MYDNFTLKRPDLVLGLALVVVGAGAAGLSASYGIGHLNDVGAGFFPLVVSLLLAFCGLLIALSSFTVPHDKLKFPTHAVRAILGIFGAICVFSVSIRQLGLIPAIALTVVVSAFGSYRIVAKHVIIVAIVLPIICYLTFIVGLELRVPSFQWGR